MEPKGNAEKGTTFYFHPVQSTHSLASWHSDINDMLFLGALFWVSRAEEDEDKIASGRG